MLKKKYNIITLIPARMNSTRFPNKPMAKINGIPMIGHVYLNASKSKFIDRTYVATCDKKIYDYICSIKGNAIMTSNKHKRASDRCAEALKKIEKKNKKKYDIVVMVQGDEPMVNSKMINAAIKPIRNNNDIKVVNLFSKIKNIHEFRNKNIVKVILNNKNYAINFGRKFPDEYFYNKKISIGKQICIIPFRRDMLLNYLSFQPTFLEEFHSIDMLRLIENNVQIYIQYSNQNSYCVDTPSDLIVVRKLMKN